MPNHRGLASSKVQVVGFKLNATMKKFVNLNGRSHKNLPKPNKGENKTSCPKEMQEDENLPKAQSNRNKKRNSI